MQKNNPEVEKEFEKCVGYVSDSFRRKREMAVNVLPSGRIVIEQWNTTSTRDGAGAKKEPGIIKLRTVLKPDFSIVENADPKRFDWNDHVGTVTYQTLDKPSILNRVRANLKRREIDQVNDRIDSSDSDLSEQCRAWKQNQFVENKMKKVSQTVQVKPGSVPLQKGASRSPASTKENQEIIT